MPIAPALRSPAARRVGASIAALAMAAAGVQLWEGRSHVVYRDLAGVATACDGITGPDVVPGKVYTDAECDALLDKHLRRTDAAIATCITGPTADHQRAALIHWAYNVGAAAACSSTLMRRHNAGDQAGAAAEFARWTWVAGKDCRIPANGCSGIPRRRAAERAMYEGRAG